MLPTSKPLLCYVTDRRSLLAVPSETCSEEPLLAAVECAATAGVDWIQLREKDLPGGRLAAMTRAALSRAARARIIVNDRPDVALAVGAGGVHLGGASLPAGEVLRGLRAAAGRDAAPRDFLVGVSTHSLEAARAAERAGASYIFFGPVFATPSKEVYGAPQGLALLAEVCRAVNIPVLAIGGITSENAKDCLEAGAAGIAAIRLFQNAANLTEIVSHLRVASSGPVDSRR